MRDMEDMVKERRFRELVKDLDAYRKQFKLSHLGEEGRRDRLDDIDYCIDRVKDSIAKSWGVPGVSGQKPELVMNIETQEKGL